MKIGQVITAVESDLGAEDDCLDDLLDATIHEHDLIYNNSCHSYQSYLSQLSSSGSTNVMTSSRHSYQEYIPKSIMKVSSHKTSRDIKRQGSSSNSLSKDEVVVPIRRVSVSSNITLDDVDFKTETNSPPASPRSSKIAMIPLDSIKTSHNLSRKGKLRNKRCARRPRSISFNETVDKVTYDEESCHSTMTSEVLEKGSPECTPGPTLIKPSSSFGSTGSLSSIKEKREDRKRSSRFFTLIRPNRAATKQP